MTEIMRVDVAPVLEAAAGHDLSEVAVLVVDVLRATTTMITAIAQGCTAIVPVTDARAARAVAARLGVGVLLAGEQEGDPSLGSISATRPPSASRSAYGVGVSFWSRPMGRGPCWPCTPPRAWGSLGW
jgi:hypothetical protein